jgi:hypothetical protein
VCTAEVIYTVNMRCGPCSAPFWGASVQALMQNAVLGEFWEGYAGEAGSRDEMDYAGERTHGMAFCGVVRKWK